MRKWHIEMGQREMYVLRTYIFYDSINFTTIFLGSKCQKLRAALMRSDVCLTCTSIHRFNKKKLH